MPGPGQTSNPWFRNSDGRVLFKAQLPIFPFTHSNSEIAVVVSRSKYNCRSSPHTFEFVYSRKMAEESRQEHAGHKRFAKLRNMFRPKCHNGQGSLSGVKRFATLTELSRFISSLSFPRFPTLKPKPANKGFNLRKNLDGQLVCGVLENPCDSDNQRRQSTHDPEDRRRTAKRYEDALQQLEESLKFKFRDINWQPIEIPKFNDFTDKDPFPQMRADVENLIDQRNESSNNRGFWSKCKHIMETIFTATSPFAKNLLQIAKEGSAVCITFSDCRRANEIRCPC